MTTKQKPSIPTVKRVRLGTRGDNNQWKEAMDSKVHREGEVRSNFLEISN